MSYAETPTVVVPFLRQRRTSTGHAMKTSDAPKRSQKVPAPVERFDSSDKQALSSSSPRRAAPEKPLPICTRLHVDIQPQPDDVTCGPTCLHAVYRYFDDAIPLRQVIDEISQLREGGTLAAILGAHALRRGYRARIYTYDMRLFDPTWLNDDAALIARKLRLQMEAKPDPKLHFVSRAYLDYLALGGELLFEDLSRALIRHPLTHGLPVIAGLSSTYLYREAREMPCTCEENDIRGIPAGHFVVLRGYDRQKRTISVADPYGDNPLTGVNEYDVPIDRVICAVLLGIVTYDANLLIIEPPSTSYHRKKKQQP